MTGLEQFADIDEKIERLQGANARLAKQLADAKHKKSELVEAVYRAASDAATGFNFPNTPLPKVDTRVRGEEIAIAVLSDWQLGKETLVYNSEICAKRIKEYVDKLIEIVNIQRADHPVKEIRIYLLGDLNEGELIFPGQPYAIDASLYQQVIVNGPKILGGAIRRLSSEFERVRVVGVVGNHGFGGKSRKDYHPETNADAMLYQVTKLTVSDLENVEWDIDTVGHEKMWYKVDYIFDHGFLLVHGDQIKGYGGVPWYGFMKRVYSWAVGGIKEPFKFILTGHYHTPFREYLNGITHWGNASTESGNTYAAEQLGASGEPSQWLLFCGKRGVTAEYEVKLGEGESAV